MSDAPAIETRDLVKVYGDIGDPLAVKAVDGVNIRIAGGESVAIMGPSGSGKSTLMHVLGCLDRPTSGSYHLAGEDVSGLDDARLAAVRNRRIGFVFQSFHLLPRETAIENVELPLLYSGDRRHREKATEALARVGLSNRGHHMPNQLSGGQKQRVAIARALVTRPAILMADEPTGALDTTTGEEIMALLGELNREGTTLVLVTHEPDIARHARRVIMMRDGKVDREGTPAEVLGGR